MSASRIRPPRMRPRFEIACSCLFSSLVDALRNRQALHPEITAEYFASEVRLGVVPEHRTLWSPYLHVRSRKEGASTVIIGQFMPQPNVWTAFMAVYGVLMMCGIFGAMYGVAQLGLGQTPWGLLAFPAALLTIAFVYGASLIGQGLGAEQMYELRSLLDAALADAEAST